MRRLLAPVMAGTLLGLLVPGTALAATPTLIVEIGRDCVAFDGAPNTSHTLWLLDGSEVLSRRTATSNVDGEGWVCFDYTIASGHKVRIRQAGLTARTMTVPNVSIRADRVTDVVSGNAPAGSQVWIYVDVFKTGTYTFSKTIERVVTASGAGAWTSNLASAGGIRGGDHAWAAIETAAGDSVVADLWVEHMGVYRGGAYAYGYINRGEVVKVTLRTSAGALRGTSTLTQIYADGDAKAAFWSASDQLVYVRAGDKVTGSFAGDAALTVPSMKVSGDAAADTVTVSCPGMVGQGVRLYVKPASGSASLERFGVVSAAGTRTWSLGTALDLKLGDYLQATCKTDPGDEVGRAARVGQ